MGKQGFASMTPEKQREIASKGGKAAHAIGTGHEWTKEEASAAGRLGAAVTNRVKREQRELAMVTASTPTIA